MTTNKPPLLESHSIEDKLKSELYTEGRGWSTENPYLISAARPLAARNKVLNTLRSIYDGTK